MCTEQQLVFTLLTSFCHSFVMSVLTIYNHVNGLLELQEQFPLL